MSRVTVPDGVEVAVHDLGGVGPDLLCDHATGFHGRVWGALAGHLDDRYHSVAFDHRAHGDSDSPGPDGFSWHHFAQDTVAVLDALGMEQPFALGHSMGGACLLLAEATRPGTFAALAVFEPVVFPPDWDRPEGGPDLAASARRRRAGFASFAEAEANYARKPPLDRLRPDVLAAYVRHGFRTTPAGRVALKCRPEDEAQVYEFGSQHSAWDRLGDVGCPVLVMRGTTAEGGVAAAADAVADRLPHGELSAFDDDLGHFGPLEQPDRVADAVADFFTRVAPGSSVAPRTSS